MTLTLTMSPKNRMATLFFYYDILERKGSLISIGNLGDSGQGPPSQVEGPTEIAATAKQPRNGRSNEGRPAPSEHKPQYKAGIRPHNAPKDYFDVFVRHCQKLQERGKNPQVHLRLVSSE